MDSSFAIGVPLTAILSDATPDPEATTPMAGAGDKASRDTHRHPRLTSSNPVNTTAASGEAIATVMFTRTFPTQPSVICTLVEAADNQPCIFKVKSWVQDANGLYIGVVIRVYRLNTLPGTLTLLSGLVNFNVANGNANSVQFGCIALQTSTV